MPKIILPQKGIELETQPEKSLMQLLRERNIPVASSCGGEGICGKCRIRILFGSDQLTPPTEVEKLTSKRMHIGEGERLSCQCSPFGDVEIETSYW